MALLKVRQPWLNKLIILIFFVLNKYISWGQHFSLGFLREHKHHMLSIWGLDFYYKSNRVAGWLLTQCISVWYNNATNQDCKALQRVVRLAERISGSALPSLQDIYLKRCKSRAAKILKDSTHPGNHLFCLLPSGKRFRSMMAKTERLRRSFFPQAIRLLNSNSVS